MSTFAHVIVWIDHRAAHLVSFSPDHATSQVVAHNDAPHSIHHKAGTMGPGHAPEDVKYFREVAKALSSAHEILIVGPGMVKLAFRNFLEKSMPALEKKVVGVETLDHPTEGQLLAFARKYFVQADRMIGRNA